MPDISRLAIEISSDGVVTANGRLAQFSDAAKKAGKSTDDLANKMGAFQLIANKLPEPLKSVAAGLMGIVSPATAVVGALMGVGNAAVKYTGESLDAFARFEGIKDNLETVIGSTEQASRVFNDLQRMAGQTSFRTDQLADAASVLRLTGMAAEDLIPTLKTLADTSNGSAQNLNQIASVYARVMTNYQAGSRDMMMLQRAGVPIIQTLRQIGVTGDATSSQLKEAFRIMTSEGGIFNKAAEASAGTLANMRDRVKELNEQIKAARAEAAGWADAAKDYTSGRINEKEDIRDIAVAQAELNQLKAKAAAEGLTGLERYRQAELELIILEKERSRINRTFENAGDLKFWQVMQDMFPHLLASLGDIGRQVSGEEEKYQNIIKNLQSIVDLNRVRQEQQDRLNASNTEYTETQVKILEAYGKTAEGQKEAIEKDIRTFQEMLKSTHLQGFDKWGMASEDKSKISYYKEVGINDDYKRMIDIIVKGLEESKDKAKKVKYEFEDWVNVLANATGYTDEMVEKMGGLKTVEKYAAEVQSIQDVLLSQDGDLIKALGLDQLDVLESSANKVRSVLEAMLNSGKWDGTEESVQFLKEALKQLDKTASDSHFDEYIKNLRDEIELLGASPALQAIYNIKKELEKASVANPTDEQAELVLQKIYERDMKELENRREILGILKEELEIRELTAKYGNEEMARTYYKIEQGINADENYTNDKKALEDKLKIIWLTEEQLRIMELTNRYGSEARAREIYALEQQIEKTLALKEALNQLKEAGLQITASGLVDFAHDLGAAFRDGSISSGEFEDSLKNMVKSMIDAMPQLLLIVGLRLMSTGNWLLGLAFVGASGLMSFVSGMIDDANDSGRNDEAERLQRIRDQITDLIDQMREQEEYYYTKKRSVDSSAISVNDAIITPGGTVYTHPEDFIIATKRPDTLMSGGGAGNVIINIENYASVEVDTKNETAEDGTIIIRQTIKEVVRNGIANGDFDGAFNAMNNRRGGRRVQN